MTSRLALLVSLALAAAVPAPPGEIARTVGKLTILADTGLAFPGGLLVVRLRRSLGTTYAIFGGQRVPFLDSARGPRALVPIPVSAAPGPGTLGIELLTRSGRQRIAMEVAVAPRSYPARTVALPEPRVPLLMQPGSVTDGRRLLVLLRTLTPQAQWAGSFAPPVGAPVTPSFGAAETFVGGSPVDQMIDSVYGEYHRGVDYEVAPGIVVQAPAGGTVLLAAPLTLSGQTLVVDHGQGVVSAFFHLGRIDVREGERVEARAAVGLSGDTGLAAAPHVHWGVYVHGVAVDPEVILRLKD